MPEATHAQTPTCKQLPLTVHDDADIVGAANGFEPFVRGGLIAVGDGDEVDGWVCGGRRTKEVEGVLSERTPAVA